MDTSRLVLHLSDTFLYIYEIAFIHSIHDYLLTSLRLSQGHFVRNLGGAGDKETETEVLLLEHDVPHQSFSHAVLSFLPKMPWSITEEVKLDCGVPVPPVHVKCFL